LDDFAGKQSLNNKARFILKRAFILLQKVLCCLYIGI